MRSILCARLPRQKEFRKQDQNGILAQNILLCGKLRLEFFREALFRTRMRGAVKWRDGNCRGDGAACALRGSEAARDLKDHSRTELGRNFSCAPPGLVHSLLRLSHGLRRGLHSFAALRLPALAAGQGSIAGLEVMHRVIYTYGLP